METEIEKLLQKIKPEILERYGVDVQDCCSLTKLWFESLAIILKAMPKKQTVTNVTDKLKTPINAEPTRQPQDENIRVERMMQGGSHWTDIYGQNNKTEIICLNSREDN
jgi:hypothetical protein